MRKLLLLAALCGFFVPAWADQNCPNGVCEVRVMGWVSAATAGQYAEDSGHTSGDIGMQILGVRTDTTTTSLCGTDADYCPLGVTARGALTSTIVTPNGQSAMDDTADAVKVLNYVSENAATATAADVDQTGAKTIITVDVGAVQASRLYCIFQNTDVAANTTLDEFNIYMAPAGYTATSMPVAYTEADFASPSGALLLVRTGAGGDTTDATPDTTLDESDYMIVWLDVSGMDSVTFQASAAADNAAVDAKCTY